MRRSCERETHEYAIAQSLQWLDDRRITVRFPARGKRRFSSSKRPDGLWDPAFHSTDTAGLFHEDRAVGAWSWLLTSRAEVKNGWRYTSTPHTLSWRAKGQFYCLKWDSNSFVARNKKDLHHLLCSGMRGIAVWRRRREEWIIAPYILNLGAELRLVFRFTVYPLYYITHGKTCWEVPRTGLDACGRARSPPLWGIEGRLLWRAGGRRHLLEALSRNPEKHGRTRLRLDEVSWNLIFESKICLENSSFIKIWQE